MARKLDQSMPSYVSKNPNERPETVEVRHDSTLRASRGDARKAELQILVLSRATLRIDVALADDLVVLERKRYRGK